MPLDIDTPGDYAEVAAVLDAEPQARVAAETRAESTEARIRELEAEVRRLRGEA